MSALFEPTALVVPFENLRMTDVESVGGKNASLGEMISPAARRRARAHRLRDHRPRLPPVPRPRRPGAEDQRPPQDPRHRGRARPGRGRRRDPRHGRGPALPGRPREGHPRCLRHAVRRQCRGLLRRAFLRHRGRPARRLIRRPAGNLPERGGHRGCAAQDEGGVRLPLQRPRHQLPRAQGLRARRGGPFCGRAAHGALRQGRRGRDVHDRHRIRLRPGGVHHLQLRPGRDGGAGRREPRRVLRAQAHAGRRQPGRDPPQPRQQAHPDGVRLARGEEGQRQAREDHRRAHRAAQPLLPDGRRGGTAGALRPAHREALRPPDGHRVGQGRHRRPALHPAGPPRDGEEPAAGPGRAEVQAQGHGHGAGRGPRHRPEDRHGPGPPRERHRRDGQGAARRRAGHRHDRPQLGARDEARQRHCHQPRRPHLPRGHHRARTRHSGRGRLRRRHQPAPRTARW